MLATRVWLPLLASAITIAGVAVLDRLAAAPQAHLMPTDAVFTGPDSLDLKPGAIDQLKNVIQQVQPPGFDCPTEAEVTVTWNHGDRIWGESVAAARRDVLATALQGLRLPRVEYRFAAKSGIVNMVSVNADTKPDRERPRLDTNSVPRKGTKVKAGDQIKVTMVARDHANLWQTGIKTIQLVAESEGGRFIASENFMQTPRVCANLPPERRVEATYTVPPNPPLVVRLAALAEDFAGNIDTDVGEFPTQGEWYGSIKWMFHSKVDATRGPTESRAETKFDGLADLSLNYDQRGNLTGFLRGSWQVETLWWGFPHGNGDQCRGSAGPSPVKADLLGTYTPGPEAVTLDSTNMEVKIVVPWVATGPVQCAPFEIDYATTLAALLRSRLMRAADGTYHAEGHHPGDHEMRWSMKLRRVQN